MSAAYASRPEVEVSLDEVASIVFRMFMREGEPKTVVQLAAFARITKENMARGLNRALLEKNRRIDPIGLDRYQPSAYWLREMMLSGATTPEWFKRGRKVL
jgi:hypothetical protein